GDVFSAGRFGTAVERARRTGCLFAAWKLRARRPSWGRHAIVRARRRRCRSHGGAAGGAARQGAGRRGRAANASEGICGAGTGEVRRHARGRRSVSPRRVFITGASTGLGHGLALHYAKPGAVLGLLARRRELLDELNAQCEQRGASAHVYAQDVADTAGMGRAIETFLSAAGGADLVIANAGVGVKSGLLEGRADDVAWLLGINVIGVTNTIVPFVPAMVQQ